MFSWAIAANAALLAFGALAKADDPEPKAAQDAAGALQITVDVPRRTPTRAEANARRYAVTVKLKNTGQEDLLLWPYLDVEVRDAQDKVVPPASFLGRYGRRRDDKSVLEDTPFITLKPGQVHAFPFALRGYQDHPDAILAWRLPAAGDYTFVFRYHYDRAEMKEAYGLGTQDPGGEAQPWDRAVQVDRTVEAKVRVE